MNETLELMSKGMSESLMRMIGLNRWVLDLSQNVLHLEFGNKFARADSVAIPLSTLESLYTPNEMQIVAEHWRAAAENGHAGPAILPFVRQDGSKAQIESVASLERRETGKYLVGVYKRVDDILRLQKRARLLGEFLDSFVRHSPSAIMVFDANDRVISASDSLGRYLHLQSVRPLIGHTIDHFHKMFDPKLISIIKAAICLPEAGKGRYVLPSNTGLHHALHWRSFRLSLDRDEAPPRVFAFDVHRADEASLIG